MRKRQFRDIFPPTEVVEGYWGLRVRSSRTIHRSCVLYDTDRGRLVLKCVRDKHLDGHAEGSPPAEVMEQVLAVVRDLALREDVPPLATPIPSEADGRLLLDWGGELFHLSPFVDGRRPSVSRREDVGVILEAYGRLHGVGRRVEPALRERLPGEGRPDLETAGRHALDAYGRLLERLEDLPAGVLRSLLARGLGRIREMVDLAREIQAATAGTSVEATVCHGDAHENNFLFVRDDARETSRACCLLDVESFARSSAVTDVAVPLSYHGWYSRFHRDGLLRGLESYEKLHPLEPGERALLFVHLSLPHRWYRAASRLLRKPQYLRKPQVVRRFVLGFHGLSAQRRLARELRTLTER